MFEPGTKVVCVNDTFSPEWAPYITHYPVKSQTYTVRDIVPGTPDGKKEDVAVYLVELVNPAKGFCSKNNRPALEPGFACHRFRELEEVPPVKEVDSAAKT